MSTKKQASKSNQPTHSVSKVVDTFRKDGEDFDTEVTEFVGAAWESDSGKVLTIKAERDVIILKGDIIKVFKKS